MKTPRTIHYSQLRYENTPYQRGGNPRVFYLEQDLNLYKEVGKDLLCLARKLAIWIKVNYRKELLIAFVMTAAFTAKGYAEPAKPPAPPIYVQPSYTKPVSPIAAVQPISVPVPQEASPVPVPQPVAPPPVAPVVAPAPVVSFYPMGANTYRDYIFRVESGFNPAAVNPGGCIGYGQDCNGWLITGRLNSVACPNWKVDIACQLQYWDWYANTIYGGWANAYAFRSSHAYW